MLQRVAKVAIGAPRRIIALAALVLLAAAIFGVPVAGNLSAGGFQDPGSESTKATKLLTDKFGQSDQQMLIVVTAPTGVRSAQARTAGTDIVDSLKLSPLVLNVSSAWTLSPQAAANLVSRDGKSGLVVASLKGGEKNAQKYARTLAEDIARDRDGVTVRVGGVAMIYAQMNQQNERDILLMKFIAVPLSFAVLLWVFGGLLAAALPMALGLLAIFGSMSVLRLISFTTDVSILALSVITATGLALAIDYTLLIISRYREELGEGAAPHDALIRTVATAGRTVLFSATTVALSTAVLVLFPMYALKSFAYAGVSTVVFVAVAAIVVTPASIVLLGPRLDSLDVRRFGRRVLDRSDPGKKPMSQLFWYRSTRFMIRGAFPIGLTAITVLVLLGVPFLGVKWGIADDRALPDSASAHQVGEQLRTDFVQDSDNAVSVVVPDAHGLTPADLDRYAVDLSQVPDVSAVNAPNGTFVAGSRIGPPSGPAGLSGGSAFLTIASTAPLFSQASETQLDRLHNVPGPAGRTARMAGLAQTNRDAVQAVTSRLPTVLGLIAVITFALLFLATGSVVLPLKALLLNVLSLTAAFGALVWVFQDGNLGGLGTTPTGTLVVVVPVVLFCIAFGLSMDYEVFLLSRIREYWLGSDRTGPANDESVACGLARTGRVITAAALVMSISFAGMIVSEVSTTRMLGVGLTLAVLVDVTLVRTVLIPILMHVLGQWNWWAPKPLKRLHERLAHGEPGTSTLSLGLRP